MNYSSASCWGISYNTNHPDVDLLPLFQTQSWSFASSRFSHQYNLQCSSDVVSLWCRPELLTLFQVAKSGPRLQCHVLREKVTLEIFLKPFLRPSPSAFVGIKYCKFISLNVHSWGCAQLAKLGADKVTLTRGEKTSDIIVGLLVRSVRQIWKLIG